MNCNKKSAGLEDADYFVKTSSNFFIVLTLYSNDCSMTAEYALRFALSINFIRISFGRASKDKIKKM